MGFRFYRRVRILPGLYLNFSKKGVSTSVGTKGARLTFSKDGTRATVGIPGSGISYYEYSAKKKQNQTAELPAEPHDAKLDRKTYIGCAMVLFLIMIPAALLFSTCSKKEENWEEPVNERMSKIILQREFRNKKCDFTILKTEHNKEARTCYMEGTFSDGKKTGRFKALFVKPENFDKSSHNWMRTEYIRAE